MAKKADALLRIPSEVPSGKDVPFQDITVMSFAEAQALDDIKLGEHVLALGNEFVKRAGSAVKFVMLHRSAIQALRMRYSKQGRRNPVPGNPSWGEFCTNVFHVSQQYMNSILASPYPKKLVAKKKTKKPSVPAATSTTVTDITTDSDPRTDGMDETAAQSVAVVATKLARMVADGHGSGKAAKGLAREIVEVDKDEPFLPTIITLESNLHVVIRAWDEFFNSDHQNSEPVKQRLVNQFVSAMSEDDFRLLCNSVIGRKKKEGKAALNAYSAAFTPQEDSDSQMVIQAVRDANVPEEEKVKALEALREAVKQEYDTVIGANETILAAKERSFQTQTEVLKRLEAAGPLAASAPEPSDAELAQQALDFVQRVTQPSGEQEGDDPHIPSHPNEEAASASTAAGRGL